MYDGCILFLLMFYRFPIRFIENVSEHKKDLFLWLKIWNSFSLHGCKDAYKSIFILMSSCLKKFIYNKKILKVI